MILRLAQPSVRSHSRRARNHRSLQIERLENRSLLATLPTGFSESAVATNISSGTAMELAPNGDLWVLEQAGAVKRFRPGSTTVDVVGQISSLGISAFGERGLLGIAFDPQYAVNKQVFLYYTATAGGVHNRISRFTVNDTSASDYFFVGASEQATDKGSTGTPTQTIIFELDPLSASNHNGGAIHFGPDGKLYVATGENAVPSYSQSLSNVLGKILRMNPDGTAPSDNPFFSSTTGKEQTIWALGLRNPYTFAFQPGTGRMFINDVGQNTWEEINDGLAGANYGWPQAEGNSGSAPTGPGFYQPPVYAYSHGGGTFQGFAITGGAFYNPLVNQFPADYAGDYFFADYSSDWINVLDIGTGNVTRFASGAGSTVDLRVGPDGSLYYLARDQSRVMRVFSTTPSSWHNPFNALDVDGDLSVAANDVLEIIDWINAFGSGPLQVPTAGNAPPPYLDVVPDNFVAPVDALEVINFINAGLNRATGEGEGDTSQRSAAADAAFRSILGIGALDADLPTAWTRLRRRS